jgi:methionine sulfoxide reductase catalytic subunit
MQYIVRKPWDLPQSTHTDVSIYRERRRHRREFLRDLGLSVAGIAGAIALPGCSRPTDEEIAAAGRVEPLSEELQQYYPAPRNDDFEYGRPETVQRAAAEYCNFYEFTGGKSVFLYVSKFEPTPWSFEVAGLCAKPRTFDMDDIYREFTLEERAYRHRCVEAWAMCVPWTGFPLARLLELVEPQPDARYVQFEGFLRPDQAPSQANSSFPWPYTEGLRLDEAMNELTLMVTGIYGEPLPKQHGAPVRIVTPWKYGFKSTKSIATIRLTAEQPETFWPTLVPREYTFLALVDPDEPHPRWSQATEWMLGTNDRFETVKYNGYGDYVADLYT